MKLISILRMALNLRRPKAARTFRSLCPAWALLLVLPLLAVVARGAQEGGFEFQIIGAGAEIAGYTGTGGAVVIPDFLGNQPVMSIRGSAFFSLTNLTSISIPNSVTKIGDWAFRGCIGLINVMIGNSVITLGEFAFSSCTNLTSVIIPNSVSDIGIYAFSDCPALTSVVLSDNLIFIRNGVFSGCSGLTSLIIPNKVRAFGDHAFDGCADLRNVNIPNSVTVIRDSVFANCTGLTNISLPNSVIFLGNYTFWGCSNLVSIDVDAFNSMFSSVDGVLFDKALSVLMKYPEGKAGAYAMPNMVSSIQDYAFKNCNGLTSLTIGNSVTSIGNFAFSGCIKLASVTMPSNVTFIGDYAFSDCHELTSVAIPDSVTALGNSAFLFCTGLTNVTLPNKLTEIGYWTFLGCSNLSSIILPSSVTSIGSAAFSSCTNLVSVYFEGPRPEPVCCSFLGSPFVTVFYRQGTAGWRDFYDGQPTAEWIRRPAYSDWVQSTGLTTQFPAAAAETDDPDSDGVTNHDEWFALTNPTQRASRLELELAPRPADLTTADQTPIPAENRALYLRSVPGRYYGLQAAEKLGGSWKLQAVAVAHSTQTRFVLAQPATPAFYRVVVLP